MLPLVDVHCHLLAGLDDGPKTDEEALAMCRMAFADGTRFVCATAHQNEKWHTVTPERILSATERLVSQLRQRNIPLTVVPCAEVMVEPEMLDGWQDGNYLSLANHKKYILIEMPHGLFVNLCHIVRNFTEQGIRPILAHPERTPELLSEPRYMEELLDAGCLMQVSARSITAPDATNVDVRQVKKWLKRGWIHLLGSDGHSPRHRTPLLAEAYHRITRWIGSVEADRICSGNGLAVIQGLPIQAPVHKPVASWFSRLW